VALRAPLNCINQHEGRKRFSLRALCVLRVLCVFPAPRDESRPCSNDAHPTALMSISGRPAALLPLSAQPQRPLHEPHGEGATAGEVSVALRPLRFPSAPSLPSPRLCDRSFPLRALCVLRVLCVVFSGPSASARSPAPRRAALSSTWSHTHSAHGTHPSNGICLLGDIVIPLFLPSASVS
jgi:hypothetical protein